MRNPLKHLYRHGKRFVAYCRSQHETEQRADARLARVAAQRAREQARRLEVRDAIRDGVR